MKNIIILTLIFLFFKVTYTQGQVTQEWVSSYGGTGSGFNFPKKSAIDNLGNYIVAGNSNGIGGYDYVVLKYTPSGNLIWSQRYNGISNGSDYLTGMVLDDSGNVYVTGVSNEGAALGGINWVTVKYNTNGQMMWKKSLNWVFNNTDEPVGINIDKEKNIYVVGFGRTISVYRQMITVKYSTDGDSLWTKVYRNSPNTHDWGYSVSIDDSLNVYSSGYGILPVGNEIVTIKYDKNGNEKWIKKYPTYDGDFLRPTLSELDNEGNLIVVGNNYISNSQDFVTLKYSTEGNLIWSRFFNNGNLDRANSLFIDDQSNILISGYTVVNNDGDYLVLKYASNGDTLFIKNINGEGDSYDEAHSIVSDIDGNIYVTGSSHSTSFRSDYLTQKLTSDGNMIWSRVYRTSLENFAYCLGLDSLGNVFISGEGELILGHTAIITVKYSTPTEISFNNNSLSTSFELGNHPNPFNPETIINFNLPNTGYIKLKIFDINGREIETIVNQIKSSGKHFVRFNGSNYSSGIYFYSLFSDEKLVKTNKMILMR
ncbi:MAG: SBBP repeat-containing protein [Ignavibacteriae bacterium]|nr:SBBP repeat-containing protein [Ignavibacteriota bacterium]